jgi:uncharacterized membrane protein
MNDRHIRILATGGILSAAIFLLTAFIRIPIPAGYLHLGDVGVFLVAMLLPAGWAAICAGVGSALADLIGFPVYTPVTFAVKALTALTFALMWRKLPGKLRYLAFLAVLIIPVGYFFFELILFKNYAWADLPLNLLQAVVGAGLALALDHATKGRFRVQ